MATTKDYIFKYEKRNQNPFEKLSSGEPWFFLRAQDVFSTNVIQAYSEIVKKHAEFEEAKGNINLSAHLLKQALSLLAIAEGFLEWQAHHTEKVKIPD